MSREHATHIPCNPEITCKYREGGSCFEDIDHKYWPKSKYRTKLEKDFRNSVFNKTLICRSLHDERHATEEPPLKPSPDAMREALNQA